MSELLRSIEQGEVYPTLNRSTIEILRRQHILLGDSLHS